jgi:hypothetical protein
VAPRTPGHRQNLAILELVLEAAIAFVGKVFLVAVAMSRTSWRGDHRRTAAAAGLLRPTTDELPTDRDARPRLPAPLAGPLTNRAESDPFFPLSALLVAPDVSKHALRHFRPICPPLPVALDRLLD